ncbi:MAG TPA: patatin-like phospholipase family protein [Myxococcota bacterium]
MRSSTDTAKRPRRAIVFSGGGARGAYEAGVVRYLIEELPRRLGHPIAFDIVCGTSVGAIHACFLAATADQGPGRGDRLVDFWRSLQIEKVFPFSTRDLIGLPRRLLGLRRMVETLRTGPPPDRLFGLLDTRTLERLVVRAIPWRAIRDNVARNRVQAVCVAATEIATGRVVVFIESANPKLPGWTRDPTVVSSITSLHPNHALASAAIPVLFPAVRIGPTYYADGGLRLNTPLSPALRLGADRILVVALRPSTRRQHEKILAEHRVEDYASPAFLYGKVLNALLLDHLDTDLARMEVMNEMIRDGQRAFGANFLDRVNEVSLTERGQRFRAIDDLVIRPSADLGMLAAEVLQNLPGATQRSPLFRLAMRNLEPGRRSAEADLMSYLLFDGEFVTPLTELGFRDARAREEDLARFFSD